MPKTYAYGGQPPGLSNRYCYGRGGRGVLGSAVPSTGQYGASPLWSGIDQGTEANSEFRWWISSPVSGGATLRAYDDCSFDLTVPGDGAYSFGWTAQKDGVTYGPATYTVLVGDASAPGFSLTMVASFQPGGAYSDSTAPGFNLQATATFAAGLATPTGAPGFGFVCAASFQPGQASMVGSTGGGTGGLPVIGVTAKVMRWPEKDPRQRFAVPFAFPATPTGIVRTVRARSSFGVADVDPEAIFDGAWEVRDSTIVQRVRDGVHLVDYYIEFQADIDDDTLIAVGMLPVRYI